MAASKRPVRLSLQQMLDGLWDEKDDENLEEGLSDDDEYVGDYEDENGSQQNLQISNNIPTSVPDPCERDSVLVSFFLFCLFFYKERSHFYSFLFPLYIYLVLCVIAMHT